MKVPVNAEIEASWARIRYECKFNDQMEAWISEHTKGDWAVWQSSWSYDAFLIWFEEHSEAVRFKLTWSADCAIER